MATTSTTELGLIKPTPGTHEPYTVANDNTNMDTLDALFSATTGHAHDAAHKGKPITTAGIGNAQVTAAKIAAEAWTAFTPTLTQGSALTLSVATGKYIQLGKVVLVSVDITINSTGTAANAFTLGALPVNSAQRGTPGSGYYSVNASATNRNLTPFWASSTSVVFTTDNSTNQFGINPAVTAAVNDLLKATLVYEAL